MEFGAILRQIRLSKGLTQEAVARQLGYRANWLCRVEKGKRKLTVQTLVELCKIYGVEPEEVFGLAESGANRSRQVS